MSHHEEKNQAAKAKAKQEQGRPQNQQGKQPGNRPQGQQGHTREESSSQWRANENQRWTNDSERGSSYNR